jgi:hypothetical protein
MSIDDSVHGDANPHVSNATLTSSVFRVLIRALSAAKRLPMLRSWERLVIGLSLCTECERMWPRSSVGSRDQGWNMTAVV